MLLEDLRHTYARKGLGFEPINEEFIDSVGHHLGTTPTGKHDTKTVVYIPIALHRGNHTPFYTDGDKMIVGEGMVEKNTQIYEWCIITHPDNTLLIEYLRQVVEATKKRWINGWENAPLWNEWVESKNNLIKVFKTKIK